MIIYFEKNFEGETSFTWNNNYKLKRGDESEQGMGTNEAAKVRSILTALKDSNISDVAKQVYSISKYPLASALNTAGYKYRPTTARGWVFVGDGNEPLDKGIFGFVKPKQSANKSHSQLVTKVVITELHAIHGQFTKDEILAIKEMLKSWQESALTVEMGPMLHDTVLNSFHAKR